MLQYNAHHGDSKPNFDKNAESKIGGPQKAVIPTGNHASIKNYTAPTPQATIDSPNESFDAFQDSSDPSTSFLFDD